MKLLSEDAGRHVQGREELGKFVISSLGTKKSLLSDTNCSVCIFEIHFSFPVKHDLKGRVSSKRVLLTVSTDHTTALTDHIN